MPSKVWLCAGVGAGVMQVHIAHSISNRTFLCFSCIIAMEHRNSPTVKIKRGPIGWKTRGGPIRNRQCTLGRPILIRPCIFWRPIRIYPCTLERPIRNYWSQVYSQLAAPWDFSRASPSGNALEQPTSLKFEFQVIFGSHQPSLVTKRSSMSYVVLPSDQPLFHENKRKIYFFSILYFMFSDLFISYNKIKWLRMGGFVLVGLPQGGSATNKDTPSFEILNLK